MFSESRFLKIRFFSSFVRTFYAKKSVNKQNIKSILRELFHFIGIITLWLNKIPWMYQIHVLKYVRVHIMYLVERALSADMQQKNNITRVLLKN